MTSDDSPQTQSVALHRRAGRQRSLVIMHGGTTQEVELAEGARAVLGRGADADVTIDDPTLSRRHLQIEVGRTVRISDLDSHNGTRLRGQPLQAGVALELVASDVIEAGNTSIVFRDEGGAAPRELPAGAWAQARMLAQRVQSTRVNVLVLGPPGGGKRTLCAEILGGAHTTIEGAELDLAKIAEIRADPNPLLVADADAIDEKLQAKFATAVTQSRARVVSTASRDLSILVAEMRYFLGLHTALCGIVIRVPPLRDCIDELPAIVEHLVRERANRMGLGGAPRLAPDALKLLTERAWPGELAELAHCIETTMVGLRGPTIRAADLRLPHEAPVVGDPEQVERQRILDALAECGGNQTQAARLLKISRRTLVSRLDRYGIIRPRKR